MSEGMQASPHAIQPEQFMYAQVPVYPGGHNGQYAQAPAYPLVPTYPGGSNGQYAQAPAYPSVFTCPGGNNGQYPFQLNSFY
jgi:hypothetical protein